ncbi:MAG: ergothioneine biosynthesis protein EgtB [Chromatiales bacterium]|jgi:ergothioneine biosynthesis protein EgtB|nr:ergothioneine biosynthesis protein EgtB [Chromatiales bacterium]
MTEAAARSIEAPSCTQAHTIAARLSAAREESLHLCDRLETEDYVVQPMPEVSPPKWHLGHTTWFFEQFILRGYAPDYPVFHAGYALLFNSYYKSAGPHWQQSRRGALSRPTVREILAYRHHVDLAMMTLLHSPACTPEVLMLTKAGIQHEQQHQELLLMDIKAILGANPLMPRYSTRPPAPVETAAAGWSHIAAGLHAIGTDATDFAYDNERPRHRVWLEDAAISACMVSNSEYREFIKDGGYENPRLWTSKGWDWVQMNNIRAPLYWLNDEENGNGEWKREFTFSGAGALDEAAPVMHISWFEADAYARWRGYRLPTEQEYEIFLAQHQHQHPPTPPRGLWCWTSSQYSPYPGFHPFAVPLAEYNGKFMCNQFVLRGGCFATPRDHYRISYRNFYEPQQRWMFSGIRLARD